jgi:hypothetical protein
MELTNALFFIAVTLLFNILCPALNENLYAFRIKCFLPRSKPHMHHLLQLMVTVKMTAKQTAFQ